MENNVNHVKVVSSSIQVQRVVWLVLQILLMTTCWWIVKRWSTRVSRELIGCGFWIKLTMMQIIRRTLRNNVQHKSRFIMDLFVWSVQVNKYSILHLYSVPNVQQALHLIQLTKTVLSKKPISMLLEKLTISWVSHHILSIIISINSIILIQNSTMSQNAQMIKIAKNPNVSAVQILTLYSTSKH